MPSNKKKESITETTTAEYKGVKFSYKEVYHLNYAVDEETGKIDYSRKDKFYTSNQMQENLDSYREAYEKTIKSTIHTVDRGVSDVVVL